MKPIIKVENLSKQYNLGGEQKPYSTFRESLIETAQKPLKMFKRGESKNEASRFWALKDVSFEVMPGEVVGIIGRNGAGKSTLLKVLSRITEPTKGKIELYGRVGSLLEVGTGFHPELTGRENIFLNGAILGMRREEIARKFDEIVDFAEVEKFLDTPVKHYSSGMYTRLAFAVAANLEPEVLIVDEVLAVGDSEFQKKCLGKMRDVSQHGRTVLFVSHQMNAVAQLCTRGIMMRDGKIEYEGLTSEVIGKYLSSSANVSVYLCEEDNEKLIQILSASVVDQNENLTTEFGQDDNITLQFKIKNLSSDKGLVCAVCVIDLMDKILTADCIDISPNCGYQTHKFTISGKTFVPSKLKFSIALFIPNVKTVEIIPELLSFEIVDMSPISLKYGKIEAGVVRSSSEWNVING